MALARVLVLLLLGFSIGAFALYALTAQERYRRLGLRVLGATLAASFVWPMGLAVQGITSNQDAEIVEVLNTLKTSTADTYLMHESFWKDNPNDFTRSWFAWANSIFAELILTVAKERPYLIFA